MTDPAPQAGWWREPSLRFYLDWHLPDLDQLPPGTPALGTALDPSGIVDLASRAGARAVIFPAKDNQGNVLWPSDLAHQHTSFAHRDVVEEFVRAAHDRGLAAVPYFQPIRDKRWFDEQQSFRQINNDGSERIEQGWLQSGTGGHRLICPLGPGGEAMLALLDELLGCYPVDGIWWDRLGDIRGTKDRYPCFCDWCRTAYARETGQDIPTTAAWSSPGWRGYWHWRSRRLLGFQSRARDLVARRRPGAALLTNEAFFGMALVDPMPPSVEMEPAAGETDVAVIEYQHFRTYLAMSLNPRLVSALSDRPVDVMAWNTFTAGDGVVRSARTSEAALATFVGLGHSATFQDTADFTGALDPRTEPMVLDVLPRAERHLRLVAGTAPVRHTGVLYSPHTVTWHRDGDNDLVHREVVGLARQVLGAHAPWELLSDRHLTDDGLAPLSVLVLPDAACLDDAAGATIERWVEAGGTLVATHLSGTRASGGQPRATGVLADVLGIDVVGVSGDRSTWMRAVEGDPGGFGWHGPIGLRTATVHAVPHSGTEVLAELATLLPGFDIFAHYLHQVRHWGPRPAITRRRHGDGSAWWVAGLCGAADLQWGVPELSRPLHAAIEQAATPFVRADAPASVEMIPRRDESRLVVTLTNLQGEVGRTHRMTTLGVTTQGISEILPVHDIRLHIDAAVMGARERLHGNEVAVHGSTVVLSRLDVSAVVEVDLA